MKWRTTLRDLTLMLASMITIIGTTAIAPSLPKMSEFFGAVADAHFLVRIAMTLPALSAGLFGPLTGFVIDRWGRKRVLVAALVVYGLSGIAGFFLSSLTLILVSRFILGISVAALTTCATALIGDYTDRSKLASSMGVQSLFMALGNVVFVSLSGVLADTNWRWPFLIYAISLLLLPTAVWLITEPQRHRSEAGSTSMDHTKERLPVARTAFVSMIGFVNMVVYFLVPAYLPFYVESFSGSSSLKVGGMLALVGLTWGIASSQYSRLRKSLSFERISMYAFGVIAIAYVLLSSATTYTVAMVALVLVGAALGTMVPNLNAWMLSFVPNAVKGRAIGTLFFFVFMGQFFSPVILQPLTAAAGYSRSYLVAGLILVPFALACGFYEFQQKRHHERRRSNAAG